MLEWWANRRYRGAWNNALWSNSSLEKTSRPLRRHSSPYCCWNLWWISADGTFSPTRNLITLRCFTLRGTFCSLITLASPRQDWTGSNPSRREGGGCGFTLSRSHSCCAVRLVYTQISPGHIWTIFYYSVTEVADNVFNRKKCQYMKTRKEFESYNFALLECWRKSVRVE